MVNKRKRKAAAAEAREQRQKRPDHAQVPVQQAADASEDDELLPGGLHRSDVQITLETVRVLASDLELFGSAQFRELRAALHPLVLAQLAKYEPVDYAARASGALRQQRWADAVQALEGIKAFGITVKQGTVQRWVRDCAEAHPAALRTRLLDLVLRCGRTAAPPPLADDAAPPAGDSVGATETEASRLAAAGAQATQAQAEGIRRLPSWSPPAAADLGTAAADGTEEADGTAAADGTETAARPEEAEALAAAAQLRVVYEERGPERQPPNHFDLKIHAASAGALRFGTGSPPVMRHAVAGVDGAFLLSNVLNAQECANLLALAKRMGFGRASWPTLASFLVSFPPGTTRDHPVAREEPWPTLAVEWLLDDSALTPIWTRVRAHLPGEMAGSHFLEAINRRWRLFSYDQGAPPLKSRDTKACVGSAGGWSNNRHGVVLGRRHCHAPRRCGGVYRPHIDGSWPGSGLKEGEGADGGDSYVHDAYHGECRSRLTFLIYLNDDFEGGETTFFLPSAEGPSLEARPVQPRRGAVLCFPQANSASLLHEGSPVTRGVKYVARTDVLYRRANAA